MTADPDARALTVTTRSRKNCGCLTPHGYLGIEDHVVAKISAWLDAHS